MAYTFSIKCAKNCRKRTILVQFIVRFLLFNVTIAYILYFYVCLMYNKAIKQRRSHVFFGHSVRLMFNNSLLEVHQFNRLLAPDRSLLVSPTIRYFLTLMYVLFTSRRCGPISELSGMSCNDARTQTAYALQIQAFNTTSKHLLG